MATLIDAAKDAALAYLDNVTVLHITSAEATSFANVAAVTLGNKASPTIGAVGDGTPDGRKRTVAAISDGTLTAAGTATHYALVSGTELIATGDINPDGAVAGSGTFTLTAFDVTLRDAIDA